ncbi:hypothetical protein [Arsukibacterium sp.]|uniref:hypothetical protein n=1 Tax=Arsukibacterium sp. TaxID=1977258 RepID=UPI002FDB6267
MLLLGCSPETSPEQQLLKQAQTQAPAARQLAQQRLANNELTAALKWFQQAALLGDSTALTHALQLQQRLYGRLATADWLQQQWLSGRIATAAVSPTERATLGLWPAEQQLTQEQGYKAAAGCNVTIQPVASQQAGVARWQYLQAAWQHDAKLAQLPVCFKPLLRMDATVLRCTEQLEQRIECQYQQLSEQVLQGDFNQLLIIAGRGIASFNNGIMQLPDTADLALLQHEFLHIAGFIDEYRLSAAAARSVCKAGRIAPNLLVGKDAQTLARYQQRFGMRPEQLTPVASCDALGLQAYRPIAEAGPMQHYQLALPQTYFDLLRQELARPERLMPVQYYFAFLARQQQAWPEWQALMQQAASQGYDDAIAALQYQVAD